MTEYDYRYDASGSMTRDVPDLGHGGAARYSDPWRYDDDTHRAIVRNVARSFEVDPLRARLAPTARADDGATAGARLGRARAGAPPVNEPIATVAELRRLHVVSPRSTVVHHPMCGHARRVTRAPLVKIGDDPRYYAGELRPGECCGPVVPTPDAPEGQPGWRWTR